MATPGPSEWGYWAAHIASLFATLGSLLGYLPVIAAGAAALFYSIQVWESRTIQHWWSNRQMRRKAQKIARLRAKEKIILAQLEAAGALRKARAEAREKVKEAAIEAAAIETRSEAEFEQTTKSTPEK